MSLEPIKQWWLAIMRWSGARRLTLAIVVAACGLLVVGAFDHFTDALRRDDILFLVRVGGLLFLAVYVVATNTIAQASTSATKATEESARAAKQAADAAVRSIHVSEEMLAEAQATRQVHEIQAVSHVVVYPTVDRFVAYLVVENEGQSFARDVRVSFTPLLPPSHFLSFVPPFFRGEPFTLAPGEKLRHPLNQSARLPASLTADVQQQVTVCFYSVRTEAEQSYTYALNFGTYFDQLVTRGTEEETLDKLDKLIKAVNETSSAVEHVAGQLRAGLLVSTSLLNQPRSWPAVAYVTPLRQLIDGMADEWRIWHASGDVKDYMGRALERRFRLLIESALVTLPNLSLSDETAHRFRSLLFDIQAAQAYPFLNSDFDENGIVTCSLDELTKLADGMLPEEPPAASQKEDIVLPEVEQPTP